jgi:hypothetical protein
LDRLLLAQRALLLEHLAANQPLTAALSAGGTTVKLPNTSKFRDGDEVFIMSTSANLSEKQQILTVDDWDTVTLAAGAGRTWPLSEDPFVLKAPGHQPLKRVHIGGILQNPDFPAITLEGKSEDNEWWSLRATSHDYKVAIRVYVQADAFEDTNILLYKYSRQVREILMDHIHPIVDGEFFPLTADALTGATVITLSSTATLQPGSPVNLRDAKVRVSSQENQVRTILSPTMLELSQPMDFDCLVARQGEVIHMRRHFYDTRASSITYGVVPGRGGPLMKAAEFDWFAKEVVKRFGNIVT